MISLICEMPLILTHPRSDLIELSLTPLICDCSKASKSAVLWTLLNLCYRTNRTYENMLDTIYSILYLNFIFTLSSALQIAATSPTSGTATSAATRASGTDVARRGTRATETTLVLSTPALLARLPATYIARIETNLLVCLHLQQLKWTKRAI